MSDKTSNLILRLSIGAILIVGFLFMVVINPGPAQNHDKFSPDNLWEAVHPWSPIADTVALIGLILFGAFLTGYLGKIFSFFTDVSKGTIQVIAAISMGAVLLFFA